MNAASIAPIAVAAAAAARRHAGRALFAATVIAAAVDAHAVPVTVSIGGLPPGLQPTLTVQRNVCPDGMGWIDNPSQALAESSLTTIERVTLPGGQTIFRSKVITRYTATFDTAVTPASSTNPLEKRCSTLGMAQDLFRFGIRVPGVNASGQAATANGFVAQTLQSASVAVNATMEARTVTFAGPASGLLPRGMTHTLDATYATSLGTVQSQRLSLQRPSLTIPGMFTTVASLFVRADGAACVQAGSTTRCLGDGSFPEAGGVLLRGLQRTVAGQPGMVRFQFELMQGFATGTLRVVALADATDLAAYIVDGTAQTMNLLPWQAIDHTVTVQ